MPQLMPCPVGRKPFASAVSGRLCQELMAACPMEASARFQLRIRPAASRSGMPSRVTPGKLSGRLLTFMVHAMPIPPAELITRVHWAPTFTVVRVTFSGIASIRAS